MTQVRPATAGDLEAMTRTFLACRRESYVDFLPPEVRDVYTWESATALWRRARLEDAYG